MKVKYRVLESRYSDGSVRFFPQSYDWWHGWRCYGQRFWTSWSNSSSSAPIWFDSLEKAETFIGKQIEWLETNGPKKSYPYDGYVHQVKEIAHRYDKEEGKVK